MNIKTINLSSWRSKLVIAAGAALLLSMAFILPATADQNPIGCDSTGVGISMTALRADGTTSIGGGSVQSGETIKYRTTLSWAGGTNCYFEGGTVTITDPAGNIHNVGNPGLVDNVTPFVSNPDDAVYVVSEANVSAGFLPADTDYTGGTAHLGDNNHPPVSASTGINTQFEDVSLEVTKTADPAIEITYNWDINKSVTPEVWDLFTGDSGTSKYTVELTKTQGETVYSVSGTITIHNPAQFADAVITDVTDVLLIDGAADDVDCGVLFPHNLAPGADLVCDYSSILAGDTTQTNTATVTTSGDVDGGSDDASVDFTNVVPVENNGTVNVNDSVEGDLGEFSDTGMVMYTRQFSCNDDEGQHDNTATIVETQQSDNASVQVNCYGLEVTKDVDTSFDRTYEWDVTKEADETEITLATGESYDIHYTVTADVVGHTDSNWLVSGQITINNPNPVLDAELDDVDDVMLGGVIAPVNCPGSIVPASGSLICTYGPVPLISAGEGDNVATAVLINNDYDQNGVPTPTGGTTDFQGTAPVSFGDPTNEFDTSVDVEDSLEGFLGTVDIDSAPESFQYTRTVMFTDFECGDHNIDNTATITTNDNGLTDEDSWSVLVHINCETGCTLTQGYWKTHNDSFHGGAPTDDNWLSIGLLGEGEEFFGSGMSWFEVFWTAPKGDAYYNLAHQYMAAVLNANNGATVPAEVQGALDDAENFFNTYAPGEIGKGKNANKQLKKDVIEWAGILGSYNEGLIGPGHCDEQNPPV